MEKKFIPIWDYCQKKGIPRQTVYRWIREHKLDDDFKREEKTVTRIMINENFEPISSVSTENAL